MKILMSLLEKMSDKLNSHGSAIAAIVSDLHSLHSKPADSVNTANVHRPWAQQGVKNNTGSLPQHTGNDVVLGNPTQGNSLSSSTYAKPAGNKSKTSWAESCAVSTPSRPVPRVRSNATEDMQSENPFIEHHSRNFKRNSRQMDSSFSPATTDNQRHQANSAQRPRRPTVYGSSSSSNVRIAAANTVPVKAVYCIDNIDVSYEADDIARYAISEGITVMSCFEVKPRKLRSDIYTNDRKAFRLCIDYNHRSKLLDSSRWPDSVIVSEWFFKSQQSARVSRDAPADKRHRSDSSSLQPSKRAAARCDRDDYGGCSAQENAVRAEVHAEVDDEPVVDMDLTIITQDPIVPVVQSTEDINAINIIN